MRKNLIFSAFLLLLLTAGSYGIFSIFQVNGLQDGGITSTRIEKSAIRPLVLPNDVTTLGDQQASVIYENSDDLFGTVSDLLDNGQFQLAVDTVDDQYTGLSREQLIELNDLFISNAKELKNAGQTDQSISLLKAFTNSFNDLDAWTLLSDIYFAQREWLLAIATLLKATALEYRPEQLERLMGNLIAVASHVRASLEGQNDELAINDLYRRLFDHHPDSARFQLELAMSYLRLQDIEAGRDLLEPLQYDVEYNAIAKTALLSLEEHLVSLNTQQNSIDSQKDTNEIVVPLMRSGNSFFVNAVINNRQLRLLLDTGASITTLTESAIAKLNLKSKGRYVQLNTANGIRRSELFEADQVKLGSLSIKNLTVAGINFDHSSGIDGLLGTDLLSQIDSRYNYVIDDQRNALIFISK